ncbi:ABC transporter permease [Actinomyces slackii]|uniref:Daunorubicin resistance ABC transporter membrane protein n=1 Tax=Actinomyces slackii TaxID=52774 RepID=A0A3S4SKS6_9ACTO|nr:ABC transporter permease [Actinomyces slackii]VEG75012.1 daunorubicin resistance ABC transporter membrane protein [Actinomyces slackii]
MSTAPAIARAVVRQVIGDLRPIILGSGAFSILASAGVFVVIGVLDQKPIEGTSLPFGAMLAASAVGATSGFISLQIVSEAYTDRIGGALVRVRVLPHGPLVWALGKLITALTQMLIIQGTVLLGILLAVRSLPVTPMQALICLPLILLGSAASAPLGFVIASLVRGVYSMVLALLAITAVVLTGGFVFPLSQLPTWLQVIQQVLPTYWAGHLSRWALVGDPSWEIGGAFHPMLALGVLLAWAVVGFACTPFIVRYSFRKESIGNLARMQSQLRTQSGL